MKHTNVIGVFETKESYEVCINAKQKTAVKMLYLLSKSIAKELNMEIDELFLLLQSISL